MSLAIPVAIIVFCLGVYGVLSKRDILRLLISVSLMLSSVTLLAVSLASGAMGQAIVLFAWVVEVIEIVIALAIFLYLSRGGKGDVTQMRDLRW